MNTQENTAPSRSRFAYASADDLDPGEGGVKTTQHKFGNTTASGGSRSTTSAATMPGVPGPDEPLLEISELARTVGMHYRHKFDFPPGQIPEVDTVAPTRGELRLTNSGAALLLRGKVESTLQLECVRCLTPSDHPVESVIEEEFTLIAANDAHRQDEVMAVDDDAPAAVIEGNVLNLADLLRQNLILAAPWQPLCREDCPGIAHESYLGHADSAPTEADLPPVNSPLRKLAVLLEGRGSDDTDDSGNA